MTRFDAAARTVFFAGITSAVADMLFMVLAHVTFARATDWIVAAAALLGLGVLGAAGVFLAGFGASKWVARFSASAAQTRFYLAFLAAFASAPCFIALTNGRRVRDWAGRPAVVVAACIAAALVVYAVVTAIRSAQNSRTSRRLLVGAAVLVFVSAACLDAFVLVRLYTPFHAALSLVAITSALIAASFTTSAATPSHSALGKIYLGSVVVVALVGFLALQRPPVRRAISEHAPLSSELANLLKREDRANDHAPLSPPTPAADIPAQTAQRVAPANPAYGDALLITIDALRADRLGALGGNGVMPELDALAKSGVVFRHAYTTTPHTSYAITSLLAGKYLRPLIELGTDAASTSPTIADIARRHGFHTAAFFPPAVFYVDGEKFAHFKDTSFGFEVAAIAYRSADERAEEVSQFLSKQAATDHVLIWAHLFEPHEPYEPPAEYRMDGSDIALYDGEVRVADRAIGNLVRAFRERRPGGIVVVLSDHGEEFSEHGGHFHGTTLYEEQVRIPLVWSSARTLQGVVANTTASAVDIAPTLLAELGLPPDARMRGRDLSTQFAGDSGANPIVFGNIADEWMATDGLKKAICYRGEESCRLFDLVRDPSERIDVSDDNAEGLARYRRALTSFWGTMVERDHEHVAAEDELPAALARAAFGDRTIAPQLLPLLKSPRADIRGAAARYLGELHVVESKEEIMALAADSDADVRNEATIAAWKLGEQSVMEATRALASNQHDGAPHDYAYRAALALGRANNDGGLRTLAQLAADERAELDRRRAAVQRLGENGRMPHDVQASLISLIANISLRIDAINALARTNDIEARDAIRAALANETYPAAIEAEKQALKRLSHARRARSRN